MNRYEILLDKIPPPAPPKPPEEPKKEKKTDIRGALISQFIRTAEGRQSLAAAMVQPLRNRLDFRSISRRAFQVQPLPEGALPIYDHPVGSNVYVVAEDGQNILSIPPGRANRFVVPLFEISSSPQIPLSSLRQGRFELIDRAQDLAVNVINREETSRFLNLLEASTNGTSNRITISEPLDLPIVRDAFTQIEGHDLRVGNIFINPNDFASMRRFGHEVLDIETHAEMIGRGRLGSIWGTNINVSRGVPHGNIYIMAEPEFLGRMPIQQDLHVVSADDPEGRTIGWSIFERIGMACHNPNAVLRITTPDFRQPITEDEAEVTDEIEDIERERG